MYCKYCCILVSEFCKGSFISFIKLLLIYGSLKTNSRSLYFVSQYYCLFSEGNRLPRPELHHLGGRGADLGLEAGGCGQAGGGQMPSPVLPSFNHGEASFLQHLCMAMVTVSRSSSSYPDRICLSNEAQAPGERVVLVTGTTQALAPLSIGR